MLCSSKGESSNKSVFIHREYKTSESGSLVIVHRPIINHDFSFDSMIGPGIKNLINQKVKEKENGGTEGV
jgi:hypothetical protein